MDMRQKIEELNKATLAYDKGTPYMSDEEWDKLYFALDQEEKKSGIIYPDSPTQSIQYEVVSKLEKVNHSHPMLSLAKTKEINSIISIFKNKRAIAMSKLDGLTCSLTYNNGKLVRAETRGNGEIGEDITHTAKVVANIPQTIKDKGLVVIDGEMLCTWNNFKHFENEYKNPRNFAAGSIRLLDAKECAQRHLSFVVWDVITNIANTLHEKLEWATNQGFEVVPFVRLEYCPIEEAINFIQSIEDYPIDGVVFKLDDCEEYYAAGRTEHHFNGGIAYKFYDEQYDTELIKIEWSVGRTGVVTPIAIFNTIDIEGSEVSRASLHNVSVMLDTLHGAGCPNQKIKVSKMNLIIPQVVWAEEPQITQFSIPEQCPECGSLLRVEESDSGVKQLVCYNIECPKRLINKLDHFFGKKGLDIKGLSKATFEKLIDWGWVDCISDVFTLKGHEAEWISKPGFGEKSVSKLLEAIDDGCSCELYQLIAGIGIPLIGTTYAKTLAKTCETWEVFRALVQEHEAFYTWGGFGVEIHQAITNYDYTEIDNIYNEFLKDKVHNSLYNKNAESNLNGINIVITGKLIHYKNRSELVDVIESHGGKVVGSVSSKTNYLINNDVTSTSSKNNTAKKLNIPIITEQEFIDKFLT